MSVEQIVLALHHSQASGTDKVVLIGIANHDGDGGAWPSIDTLARYANVSHRAVQNAVARLVELGEIVVHRQDGGTHRTDPRYRPNRYEITLRCPADCDGSAQHRRGEADVIPGDPGVKPATPRGEAEYEPGVKPASPEPSLQPVLEPSLAEPTFDDFWALYPRKEAKQAAASKWKLATRRTSPTTILDGLRRRVAFWELARTDRQFIPHASVWLNQHRWEDEIGPVPKSARRTQAGAQQDRLDAMRTEVETAIADGNPALAWEIICQRAAADGRNAFVRAATMLGQRSDPAIAALTRLSVDEVAAIRRMHAQVVSGVVTDVSRYSLTEGTA